MCSALNNDGLQGHVTLLGYFTKMAKGWFTLRHKHKNCKCERAQHKHKHLVATAQAYLHFAHVYLHTVIQDRGPPRRGRIARNWDFASSFTGTKKKSKESTNTKKEKYMGSQSF